MASAGLVVDRGIPLEIGISRPVSFWVSSRPSSILVSTFSVVFGNSVKVGKTNDVSSGAEGWGNVQSKVEDRKAEVYSNIEDVVDACDGTDTVATAISAVVVAVTDAETTGSFAGRIQEIVSTVVVGANDAKPTGRGPAVTSDGKSEVVVEVVVEETLKVAGLANGNIVVVATLD